MVAGLRKTGRLVPMEHSQAVVERILGKCAGCNRSYRGSQGEVIFQADTSLFRVMEDRRKCFWGGLEREEVES